MICGPSRVAARRPRAPPVPPVRRFRPGRSRPAQLISNRALDPAVRIFVSPDHLFEEVRRLIDGATETLDIWTHTLSNADLVDAIVARQGLGVAVRLVLDRRGALDLSPPERWAAHQLEQADAAVYVANTDRQGSGASGSWSTIVLVDELHALVGSEDLDDAGMPADAGSDGTAGRRGTHVLLTAPVIVEPISAMFAEKLATAPAPELGPPPEGLEPSRASDEERYRVLKRNAFWAAAPVSVDLLQCLGPRDADALSDLMDAAGPGHVVLVELRRLTPAAPSGGDQPPNAGQRAAGDSHARITTVADAPPSTATRTAPATGSHHRYTSKRTVKVGKNRSEQVVESRVSYAGWS